MADGARIILRDTGPILRSPLLFRRAIATMAMALLSYGHSPVPISGVIGWRACEPFGRSDMPASAAGMSDPCASGQRAHGKTITKGDQSGMDMKKISAACATAAALAALCVPGAAFAADGTLTLNAGDGSTLAGHSFTVYKLANYNDVVKDGANVKSVSASSPDAAADAWVKAALNKNGVTYNTSEGRNAAEQLLRLQTDSNTLRKVAGTLQSTAVASKVTAVKTNQTSTTGSLNLTLPEGYYLVVDAQGIPILVSTTIGGATRMSNGQVLGSTQIKTNVTKIDKKIQAGLKASEKATSNAAAKADQVMASTGANTNGMLLAAVALTGIGWTMLDMKRRRMDVTARHGRR